MNEQQIIKRYERVGAWVSGILAGVFFVVISCLQPIDGIPGYQLVTREDFSILFGFAFAGLIGGGIGAAIGMVIGRRFGVRAAPQILARRITPLARMVSSSPPPFPATRPVASTLPYRASASDLQAAFGDVFMEITFEQTEALLARGESPTASANQAWLVQTCTNLAVERIRQRYNLTETEAVRVVEDYVRSQSK